MRIALRLFVGVVISAITVWGVGALYFFTALPSEWRAIGAGGYALLTILLFSFLSRRGKTAALAVFVFAILVVLFLRILASNDRDWQPEVANLPYATINGDRITIHNVRNFTYRTETDFTPRWETRTYDLSKLDSVDLIAVYWAGKAIAHIMVSFGFAVKII